MSTEAEALKKLKRSAAAYLARYAASAGQLRTVLQRQISRRARRTGEDQDAYLAQVNDAVSFFVAHGLIDDRSFAESRVKSLRQRGWSTRRIQYALRHKGIAADTIEIILKSENDAGDELSVARRFAERRRLGPWRLGERQPERRSKDIAAMVRAGFAFSISRAIVDEERQP